MLAFKEIRPRSGYLAAIKWRAGEGSWEGRLCKRPNLRYLSGWGREGDVITGTSLLAQSFLGTDFTASSSSW